MKERKKKKPPIQGDTAQVKRWDCGRVDVHAVPEVAPDRHYEDGDEELVILVMMVYQMLQKPRQWCWLTLWNWSSTCQWSRRLPVKLCWSVSSQLKLFRYSLIQKWSDVLPPIPWRSSQKEQQRGRRRQGWPKIVSFRFCEENITPFCYIHSIPDFLLRITNTIHQEIVVDVAKAAVEDDGDDDEDIIDDGEGDDGEYDDALQDQQGHFQVALSLLAHWDVLLWATRRINRSIELKNRTTLTFQWWWTYYSDNHVFHGPSSSLCRKKKSMGTICWCCGTW